MSTSQGGPAFPQDYEHTKVVIQMRQAGEISAEQLLRYTRQLHGMTLRDYFAAKAMHAMIASTKGFTSDKYAKAAYEMADAMLCARGET